MAIPLIEFKNVSKAFDDNVVLNNVDLQIYEGQITVIIGKSGTGKTVLLKHIIGLLAPDSGEIFFKGNSISKMSKREKAAFYRQCSYMFQGNALFDGMTVLENISLPLLETTRLRKKVITQKAMELLRQLDLEASANKYPSELSGGQQKRVAMARALVTDPKIILFDEPTTGQDPIRKNAILSMIAQSKKRFGYSAIVISHDIPDIYFISDRIILLWDGKVGFQGTWMESQHQDFPLAEEYLASLEGFEDQLTGLLSKQMFRSRYQTELSARHDKKSMAVVVFSVELELITEQLGAEAAVTVVKRLGEFISSKLDAVGGFSTRQARDHILTVFPHMEYEEVLPLLENFSRMLQGEALHDIQTGPFSDIDPGICTDIVVYAGVSELTSNEPFEDVYKRAKSHEKIIAQYQCKKSGGRQA